MGFNPHPSINLGQALNSVLFLSPQVRRISGEAMRLIITGGRSLIERIYDFIQEDKGLNNENLKRR